MIILITIISIGQENALFPEEEEEVTGSQSTTFATTEDRVYAPPSTTVDYTNPDSPRW